MNILFNSFLYYYKYKNTGNNEEQTEINKETENIENENNEIKNEENTEKLENESLEKNEEIEHEKNTEEEKKEEIKEESEEKEDPFKDLPLYIISCKVSIINSDQIVLYTLKGKRVKTEIREDVLVIFSKC